MKTNLEFKIINYLGDYGTANFWSNITDINISEDLKFIKEKGFNTVLLMIPYCAFKPSLDSFENKYEQTLQNVLTVAEEHDIHVIFRIGYLWESSFDQERTLERYIDMFSKYKDGNKSVYEDDFINYVNHFYDNYSFLHMMISWEDFFWPINFYNLTRNNDNQENERETIAFMEYLLGRIGYKEKLFVEQRTNGDFNKINYNPAVSYAYYNTYNIQSWDDDYIDKNFGRGILISESMLIEKQFIEWLSRMKQELNLNKENKLIIDQFNIIDNTFSDDDDHQEFNVTKQKLLCDESNLEEVMDFLVPVIKNNIYGIGFWSLWSTYAGHVYNGTFKFGAEGWDTDGQIINGDLLLNSSNYVASNLGYVRLDSNRKWNILLEYSSAEDAKILISFNNTSQVVNLSPADNRKEFFSYAIIQDRGLKIEVVSGRVAIHRIDCFNIMHKSILFDENRESVFDFPCIKDLLS